MNAFIASEFGYCQLVWMVHSRKLNSQVNKLHERVLKKSIKIRHFHLLNSLRKIIRQLYTTEIFSC